MVVYVPLSLLGLWPIIHLSRRKIQFLANTASECLPEIQTMSLEEIFITITTSVFLTLYWTVDPLPTTHFWRGRHIRSFTFGLWPRLGYKKIQLNVDWIINKKLERIYIYIILLLFFFLFQLCPFSQYFQYNIVSWGQIMTFTLKQQYLTSGWVCANRWHLFHVTLVLVTHSMSPCPL